jgi:hypothetical protein
MEKNHKKDLEHLLFEQTEKILLEIDPAATVIFSKNIKSYCKDLAKKFLKTQKKYQKQREEIATIEKATQNKIVEGVHPLKVAVKKLATKSKSVVTTPKKTAIPKKKAAAKSTSTKRSRKGNNLFNAATVQNKVKAELAKSIIKSAKK